MPQELSSNDAAFLVYLKSADLKVIARACGFIWLANADRTIIVRIDAEYAGNFTLEK